MSLKNDTIKGTFWSSIEKFSLLGIQFVLQIVLARLLTPIDYGIIGILAVLLQYLILLLILALHLH